MRAVRNRRCHHPRAAFSLLELLIVLAIIGVIAAMVVPDLVGRQQQASIDITKQAVHSLEQALKLYAADHNGQYPPGGQEALTTLIQPMDKNNQPMPAYIEKIPVDAWGNPLFYQYPADKRQMTVDKPAIWSSGPDGKNDNGSNDDINNWTIETQA